ncbi:hypothetical protein EV175_000057 [Coemansia sp. RSA 1933]|nr:hypothetical protein EV175_000057 [Coemansia sp. RSA 1933]
MVATADATPSLGEDPIRAMFAGIARLSKVVEDQAQQHANLVKAVEGQTQQHANLAKAVEAQTQQHANLAKAVEAQAQQHANLAKAVEAQAQQHANLTKVVENQAKLHAEQGARFDEFIKRQDARDAKNEKERKERDEKYAKEQKERDERLEKMFGVVFERLDQLGETPRPKFPSMALGPVPFASPSPRQRSVPTAQLDIFSIPENAEHEKPRAKLTKAGPAEYTQLSHENDKNVQWVPMEELLQCLGEGWGTAWDRATADNADSPYSQVDLESILAEYNSTATPARTTGYISEEKFQEWVGELIPAIETRLRMVQKGEPKLRWEDRHERVVKSSQKPHRKPDGVFYVGSSDASDKWPHIVVTVEIKGSHLTFEDKVLRGQLIWNFIDMARDQPRRFTLELSVSGQSELHAYVSTANKIFYTRIGSLPSPGSNTAMTEDQKHAVKFFIMLYRQLPLDYGFLVHNPLGIQSSFKLTDIPDLSSSGVDVSLQNATIKASNIYADGGRREGIAGPRSWVYPVDVQSLGYASGKRIFKFHWHYTGKSEAMIHKRIQNMNVPHVPRLFHSGNLTRNPSSTTVGEVLIMENAGEDVFSLFKSSPKAPPHRIVDVFAGYVHTLLAANKGNKSGLR